MSTANSGAENNVPLQQRLRELRQALEEMVQLLDRAVVAEEALHQSEERFRMLVSGVRDYAIFMLDPQGYIVSWNLGAQLLKGYNVNEIIGQHFSIFYPAIDLAAGKPAYELEVASEVGRYEEEGWRVRKDGSLFWANVVITALYDSEGLLRGFGKVTRDMTERRQAEDAREQLRQRNRQLELEQATRAQVEATLRSRDEFLIATSHELRTPVTALLGYGQLLRRRLDSGPLNPERDERIVRAMIEQAARLNRLTTTLLDMNRLAQGALTLDRVTLDLRGELVRSVEQLQLLTEKHTLQLELPEDPLMIDGDELALEQIFYNLLLNAIKYSPAGGIITVTPQPSGNWAVVAIRDMGIGIPSEELSQIFDRFYRAKNIDINHISGLGLGLYLVKELLRLHDGTISVQSAPGEGSIFTVSLPLKEIRE